MIRITKTSPHTRQRGHTLNLYGPYSSPGYLVLPPLLHFYYLHYLGRQLLNQPFLVYVFPLSTRISSVSYMASTTLVRALALLHLSSALPDPILVAVLVPIHIPVPIYATARFRPRSRPRSHRVSVHGSPSPSPFPSPFRPVPISVPVPILRSFVRLHVWYV